MFRSDPGVVPNTALTPTLDSIHELMAPPVTHKGGEGGSVVPVSALGRSGGELCLDQGVSFGVPSTDY